MRIAVILDGEEAAAHHARQAQKPDLLDPDPEQRRIAEAIDCGLWGCGMGSIANEDADRAIEGIDLFETLSDPDEPPRTRYLYTLLGEGF